MENTSTRSVAELTLSAAQQIVAQGLGLAAQRGLTLSFAVVDQAGHALAFARMDGAPIVTIDVAFGKARTAAYLKAPSKIFEDMINAGHPSMTTTPGLLPLQGGMPVLHEGMTLGAVGVSGASGEVDQDVAAVLASTLTTR